MVLAVDDVACATCRDCMIGEAIASRLTCGDAELRSTDLSNRVNELLPTDSPLVTVGTLFRSKRAAGASLIRLELKLSAREKPDDSRIWPPDGAD